MNSLGVRGEEPQGLQKETPASQGVTRGSQGVTRGSQMEKQGFQPTGLSWKSLPGPRVGRCVASLLQVTLLLAINAAAGGCFFFRDSRNNLEQAEELSRQNKIPEAIAAYRRHIAERMALDTRAEWENPYFYLILIGDLQLRQGDVNGALETFKEAQQKGVHVSLISDRYRAIARWYEERGDLEAAFQHLKKHRDLDPLLFDAMLDRLAREIVEKEDAAALPAPATSPGAPPAALTPALPAALTPAPPATLTPAPPAALTTAAPGAAPAPPESGPSGVATVVAPTSHLDLETSSSPPLLPTVTEELHWSEPSGPVAIPSPEGPSAGGPSAQGPTP